MMIIAFIGVALLGISTWWALEYVLHRFVGHKPRGRTLFSREHRRHHAEGDYFAPTWRKALGVAPPLVAACWLLSLAIGWALSAAYCLGLLAMYMSYEVFHRRLHTHPPGNRYGQWARRHHFHHHFVNPKANHGVTTHFGDILMGTLDAAVQIPVPERLAMTWLLDEASGEVMEPYREQYRLVPLKR